MLEKELIRKQEELDLLKYNQSSLARTDLAGKMPYCKGCIIKTDMPSCVMNHETRQQYCVCARNYFRLEKEKENEPRKTRKRSNG